MIWRLFLRHYHELRRSNPLSWAPEVRGRITTSITSSGGQITASIMSSGGQRSDHSLYHEFRRSEVRSQLLSWAPEVGGRITASIMSSGGRITASIMSSGGRITASISDRYWKTDSFMVKNHRDDILNEVTFPIHLNNGREYAIYTGIPVIPGRN